MMFYEDNEDLEMEEYYQTKSSDALSNKSNKKVKQNQQYFSQTYRSNVNHLPGLYPAQINTKQKGMFSPQKMVRSQINSPSGSLGNT